MTVAEAIPSNKASIRCRLARSKPITNAGDSKSSSAEACAGASASAVVAAVADIGVSRLPKSVDATRASSPAGMTYLSRLRTVPPMSTCCEPLDAMVVSETGEMESPNVAPARIAPISAAGGAPAPPPAG